jgi:DNA-binding transcriptional LysR family regulator
VRSALDTACANAGLAPHIAFEATALPMVAELAGHGLGVGILPQSIANGLALTSIEIVRPRLRSRLEFIWKAPSASNPAARALIDHARTFLGKDV